MKSAGQWTVGGGLHITVLSVVWADFALSLYHTLVVTDYCSMCLQCSMMRYKVWKPELRNMIALSVLKRGRMCLNILASRVASPQYKIQGHCLTNFFQYCKSGACMDEISFFLNFFSELK